MVTAFESKRAAVLWFTGLSGSGKSTIAERVAEGLARRGVPVERLDGDTVRDLFPTGFTKPERDLHVRRMAYLASRLEHHGVTVVASRCGTWRGGAVSRLRRSAGSRRARSSGPLLRPW